MSQYVPGVIDYVPDIQPYKPDLNFFQQVLQTKQAQYDVGYKKLSSLYGTLLNSPMLKHENIELRNKFFNDISANITKISGMDLSVEQNVNSARKVFQPLIDNDYIMKDMAYTKKYQQALDRHEYFKNCTDEKTCGGKYWTDGLKYINYQAEDFINSSLDESLSFQNPEYIPYTNAIEKAMKFAKEMGFAPNNFTRSGGYNIITENGVAAIPDLTDFFMSNFSNDGNIRQVYDVLAYNKRKDYAKNNAQNFGGSEEQAEMNYLDSMAGFISATTETEKERALQKLDASRGKQKLGEQIIKQVGVDPDDPDDQGVINNTKQSITDQLVSQDNADFYEQTNEIVSSNSFNDSDLLAKRNRIDAAMANSLFAADMMSAASSYAKLNYKIKSYEADPFALKRMEHRNAVELENLRAKNARDLARDKGELVEASEEPPVTDPPAPGSSFENADLLAAEETVKRTFGQNMAGATLETMMQIKADLDAAYSIELGKPLPTGVIQTEESKKEILRAKETIFNQGQQRTATEELKENSTADYLWTDLKASMYSAWNWITGDSSEEIRAKEKAYVDQELAEEAEVVGYKDVQVTDKGFLDAYGNVSKTGIENNSNFYDPNSVNHYEKVFDRITKLYADPNNSLLVSVIGKPSADLQGAIDATEKQKAMLKLENDRIAHNTAVITRSFDNMDIDLSDFSDPVLARQMASQITYGDDDKKYFRAKEDFVSSYVKEFKKRGEIAEAKRKETLSKLQGMSIAERVQYKLDNGIGYLGTESPLYQSNDTQVQMEAAALYDEYMDKFKSEYNRADDASKPYADFRTINAYGGGGAGGQASPYTIKGVDPRFPNTPGASNFKWTHNDLQRAISDPAFADRIAVFNGDPGKFTALNLNEAFEKGVNPALMSILDMTRDDIRQGNKKEDAARFDIQVFPVAGNSPDLVAFKIRYSPKFIEGHKGGKETAGYTSELFEGFDGEIGIIMPREAISKDNPALAGLNRTPEDMIMDAYNEVNITAFSEFGGRATLKREGTGIIYDIRTQVFDPSTGKFTEMPFSSGYNSELSAGAISKEITPMLMDRYRKNQEALALYKKNNKGNRITDPAQLGLNP
jgi:hypothetical protein